MIPEQNDDAAPLGAPGRTMIVGSRTILPSIRPRLEKSLSMISQICFSAPYEEPGCGMVDSVTVVDPDGPNTASDEGKMTLTPGIVLRRMSRMRRVESMFTRSPRSRLASAAPDMRPWRRYT